LQAVKLNLLPQVIDAIQKTKGSGYLIANSLGIIAVMQPLLNESYAKA